MSATEEAVVERRTVRGIGAALVLVALSGGACRSIRATYVGQPVHGEEVGGLPIVVMQPRYLKVTYKTVTYRIGRGERAAEQECREIATETVECADVYALDVDRPAAGSTDYAVEIAKDRYYPAKVAARLEDETLSTVASMLEELAEKVDRPRERALVDAEGGDRVPVREAVERIEIYDLRDLASPVAVYR